jgi:NAD(P)-dependent dehydrogenase (short-subunit alcohol dehydrogenase family)
VTHDLQGKTALVTGASSGIGRAAAVAPAEEMARSVVWLLSDASAFLTGQAVVVDGGIGLYT